MEEIGNTGLQQYGGRVYEEFLTELRFGPGSKGYSKYNEMRNNAPVIASLLAAIEQSIMAMGWQAESNVEDDPRLELLQTAIEKMRYPLKDHLSEALTALVFGWAYFETVWKRDGSQVLWDYIAPRPQDTLDHWEFGKGGELLGMWQTGTAERGWMPVLIPVEKAIHYTIHPEKCNPEGRSMLRPSYTSYYFWKNISTIEAIGVERDLAGLPVVHLPSGASTDTGASSDLSKAEKTVRNVRNDEQAGLVLPDGWGFELLSSGGSKQFDTDKIITRYENRMLMSALAQFLMLGSDGVGSLALSKDQTDFFTMSVNAIADRMAMLFTKYAVAPLMRFNGYDPDGIKLDHTPAGAADVAMLGTFLSQVGDKLTWTPQDELWLRQTANMPEIDTEQIENERAEKQARSEAMAQALQQRQQQEPAEDMPDMSDEDNDDEDEPYTAFAAARNHTDPEKRKWELRYQSIMKAFLGGQRKRVTTGAKGIRK